MWCDATRDETGGASFRYSTAGAVAVALLMWVGRVLMCGLRDYQASVLWWGEKQEGNC
jgi:hypothetical protein